MSLFGATPSGTGLGGQESSFRKVLTKLSTDKGYLSAASADPKMLIKDYPELTIQELDALRDAAILCGADVTNVDPLHSNLASARPGSGDALGGDITACCCCCCCGTTGAVERI